MHVIVYTYYSVGLSILYSKIPLLIMLFCSAPIGAYYATIITIIIIY